MDNPANTFNHIIAEEVGAEYKSYFALPKSGKGPGLILLHEVYGVNDSLKAIANMYAEKGFVVSCPNLYWRMDENASYRPQQPGEEMTDDLKNQRLQSYILMDRLDYANVAEDVRKAAEDLRKNPACDGKVGAMGFCLGGRCVLLAADIGGIDCGAAVYATRFEKDLENKAASVQKPLLFVVPVQDPYVSDAEKNLVLASSGDTWFHVIGDDLRYPETTWGPVASTESRGNPKISAHFFPNQDHAFIRVNGLNFDAAAASRLHEIIVNFLNESLDLKMNPPEQAARTSKSRCNRPEWC
jgi:carboxymethylenebutenolidase